MNYVIERHMPLNTRKLTFLKTLLSFAMVFFCFFTISVADSHSEVNVNIGVSVPLPPPFVFHAPPPVVILPGAEYVYFAPGLEVDIFFYRGFWYRAFNQRWYRASSYNGPWAFMHPDRVPRALYSIPPDYRRVPPGHQHIPYGHLKKNWGAWERDRHWDRRNAPPPPGRGRYEGRDQDHGRGRDNDRDRDWDRRGPEGHGRGHGPR